MINGWKESGGSLDEKEGWISGWKERSSVDEKKTEAVDEKDGTMP